MITYFIVDVVFQYSNMQAGTIPLQKGGQKRTRFLLSPQRSHRDTRPTLR